MESAGVNAFVQKNIRTEFSIAPSPPSSLDAKIMEGNFADLPLKFFDATTNATGTGLGLAVAQRIVALLGGIISFESTPGAGTAFSCNFPPHQGLDMAETRARQLPCHRFFSVEPGAQLAIPNVPER